MKNIIFTLFAGMLLSGCHQNLGAVNQGPQQLQKNQGASAMSESYKSEAKQAVSYESMIKGDTFTSGQESFVFLPELYSVANANRSDSALAGNIATIKNEKSASLIQTKGKFEIYKAGSGEGLSAMSAQVENDLTLNPVVLNPRTNNLGIITGDIRVVLNDNDDAKAIASEIGLNIRRAFAHLKTVFYSVAPGQNILEINNALQADSRVVSSDIEILEHVLVPQ